MNKAINTSNAVLSTPLAIVYCVTNDKPIISANVGLATLL